MASAEQTHLEMPLLANQQTSTKLCLWYQQLPPPARAHLKMLRKAL